MPLHDDALQTENYHLRPLATKDAPALFKLFSDPAVVEYMDIDPCPNLSAAAAIIEWTQAIRRDSVGIRWGVFSQHDDDRLIGTCGFNQLVRHRAFRGEVAYDLAREWWGRGVMREVLPRVLAYGFGHVGLRRIEALVTPGNERSCRLLERSGFQHEACLRSYAYWKGQFWDQLLYARIDNQKSRRQPNPSPTEGT
jgi:[ribosomal protein S5]-alanine N-acetyltransferase